MKNIHYKHYICISITIAFLVCSFCFFPFAFIRLYESIKDFITSIGIYFAELFNIKHGIEPTINNFSVMPGRLPFNIPYDKDSFILLWNEYWTVWASVDNLKVYGFCLSDVFFIISKILLLALPILVIIYLAFIRLLSEENNKYNVDSLSLVRFKKIVKYAYIPVKNWLISFYSFLLNKKYYFFLWCFIWLLNFNFIVILIEFFSFYFYFVATFNVSSFFIQIYKLFIDLSVAIYAIPVWLWVVIGYFLLCVIRSNIGLNRLVHFEMKNRGFINDRPIVFMVCGTMGKKKTTCITDIALSQEVMFRDKAFEKLLECDMKFPNFSWINLENDIKNAIDLGIVYNLASVKKYIRLKERAFDYIHSSERNYYRWLKRLRNKNIKSIDPGLCYFYDFNTYGLEYYNELKTVYLWDIIEDYAQLYFIYIVQSSLLISNYSVRSEAVYVDKGNFPIWNNSFFDNDIKIINVFNNFFRKNDKGVKCFDRYAHILDFDSIRLGKKVIENNPNANSFEFGVVLITEVGKERGNALELLEKKKNDFSANQKNDLFNSWLKMVRHSATVDNFPFVSVITDEQRPESWGADARDLCDIVRIKESCETKLAMPFFALFELLHSLFFSKFTNLYYKYRHVRSDSTLPMYILKSFTSKLHKYYNNVYNRFGFCPLLVQVENGTQDGTIKEKEYYLMHKKIYSNRFSTDCFSEYFNEKSLRSPIGLNNMHEYKSVKATFAELKKQNSYFINDLLYDFEKNEINKRGVNDVKKVNSNRR